MEATRPIPLLDALARAGGMREDAGSDIVVSKEVMRAGTLTRVNQQIPIRKLIDNAETCAAMTRAAVAAMGLQLFAPKGHEAAATTAIVPPAGVDSGDIVNYLRSKFAIVVTDGQGEMKGSLFRIAHIGYFDYMDTIAIVGALEQIAVILKLPLPNLAYGTGLIAAQKVFAELNP